MSKYTKEQILKEAKENGVEFIRLQFTDLFGIMKNVAITFSQLEKALDNDCMFDGSSIDGFVRIDEVICICILILTLGQFSHGASIKMHRQLA